MNFFASLYKLFLAISQPISLLRLLVRLQNLFSLASLFFGILWKKLSKKSFFSAVFRSLSGFVSSPASISIERKTFPLWCRILSVGIMVSTQISRLCRAFSLLYLASCFHKCLFFIFDRFMIELPVFIWVFLLSSKYQIWSKINYSLEFLISINFDRKSSFRQEFFRVIFVWSISEQLKFWKKIFR